MADAPSFDGVLAIERGHPTLADQVEVRPRHQIVRGDRLTGSRLNEVDVAVNLGVSCGPVQEALQRLAQHGLMTLEPYRGAFVRRLDLAETGELSEVRTAPECEAAQLVAVRISTARPVERVLLQEATTSQVSRGPESAVLDHFDLHMLVVRHADNDRLSQAVTQVNVELRVAHLRSAATGERSKEAVDEHRQLVTCLTKRDGARVRVSMKHHLTASPQDPPALHAGSRVRPDQRSPRCLT